MLEKVAEQAGRGIQFFSVLWDTVITQGGELASEETIGKRLAICQACPKFRPDANRCGLCGCKINTAESKSLVQNLGNKIAHRASRCPIGRWEKEPVLETKTV